MEKSVAKEKFGIYWVQYVLRRVHNVILHKLVKAVINKSINTNVYINKFLLKEKWKCLKIKVYYLIHILFVYLGFIHFVLLCKLILFIYLYLWQPNYCILFLTSYCNWFIHSFYKGVKLIIFSNLDIYQIFSVNI